jgi:hypothetical protein
MFKEGKPGGAGPPPQSEAEHFIRCTLDMRHLGQVLDHLHGQEIEEEPTLQ